MKILVAKDAGYCFGVRDAVNLAHKTGQEYEEEDELKCCIEPLSFDDDRQ